MDLVDKAFFRWQMHNQPRRFRESLAAARDEIVCALSLHERMQRSDAHPSPFEASRKGDRS